MLQWLRPIPKQLCVSDAPNPIYQDIQPTIDFIKDNQLTSQVKHIDVPIHYVHEKDYPVNIEPVKLKNITRPYGIGTK